VREEEEEEEERSTLSNESALEALALSSPLFFYLFIQKDA